VPPIYFQKRVTCSTLAALFDTEHRIMAKLYFYYSAMNAGKSTVLLQSSHNYRERGIKYYLLLL
jgi:thymidine kinase